MLPEQMSHLAFAVLLGRERAVENELDHGSPRLHHFAKFLDLGVRSSIVPTTPPVLHKAVEEPIPVDNEARSFDIGAYGPVVP